MAPVGMIMPELAKQRARIIDSKKSVGDSESEKSAWNKTAGMIAARSGNYCDFTIDCLGRSLIAGYFGNAKRGNSQTAILSFITCYSENNPLQWLRKFQGSGKPYGFAVEKCE